MVSELNILLILCGIGFIGYGIFLKKNPDFAWEYSLEKRRYVEDDAPPTARYYEYQKASVIFSILIGTFLIFFTSLFMLMSIEKYVVEINGNELKLPCSYSDIEELGFTIVSDKEIRTLEKYDSVSYTAINAVGEELKITFENNGDTEKLATDCKITAIYVTAKDGPDIELPNGVHFGMRESQVEDIMGHTGINENYEEIIGFKTYEISVGFNYTNYINPDNYNPDSGIILFSSVTQDEEISWIRVSLEKY